MRFEGVDVAVDVGRLDFEVEEVVVELLGHALGEGGDEGALVALYAQLDFFEKMVDLVHRRHHAYGRIEKARGAYDLLDHDALAALELIVGWSGAYEQCLARERLELVEGEGAVVERGREAEAVFHQVLLARAVAAVHGAYLRHRNMAFVDDGDEVLGKIIEKTEGSLALAASVEVARVVLYAGAVAELLYHFHVVGDALFEALGLELLALLAEKFYLLPEVELYLRHGGSLACRRGDEEVGRVDFETVVRAEVDVVVGVDGYDLLHLVAPEDDADDYVLVGEADVDCVALHAEVASLELPARCGSRGRPRACAGSRCG